MVWLSPSYDTNGHQEPPQSAFTALANANFVLQAAAGSTASLTSINAIDRQGGVLFASAGTGQATGNIMNVTFASPWESIPVAIILQLKDTAAFTDISVLATAVTAAGFSVSAGSALTAAHNYLLIYQVMI